MAKHGAHRIGRRYGWHWSVAAVALVGSGCAQNPYSSAYPAYPAYDYSAAAPRPAPQPVAAPQVAAGDIPYQSPAYQALEGTSMELKERLERVEKAMLRLDRRMQLVERNELSRMNGRTSSLEPSAGPAGGGAMNVSASGSDADEAMAALGLNEASGYRPVASRNEQITSALQAAPSMNTADIGVPRQEPVRLASRGGLPSLADPVQPAGRDLKAGQQDVAIWTVRYESGKVWPDSSQLPSSRDVVDVLRENGKANIYARGKNASAVEFRDRVKALSRYLSKVSSLDTVPIAAMAAPHLDDETIEIVVTH